MKGQAAVSEETSDRGEGGPGFCLQGQERRLELVAGEGGSRLDRFLVEKVPELTRSAARKLIDAHQVTVNRAPTKASYQVRPGDIIVACLPSERAAGPVAEMIPLSIVYEDAWLLAVDKPAGMVVHPAAGHASGTLVNALLAHCPELIASGEERPGIVHRLDRDTSGLIVVAKNEAIRRLLQQQFKEHRVRKRYLALLHGHLQPPTGRIEAALGRDPHHRQRIAVLPHGREAVTDYRVLEHLPPLNRGDGPYTLVEVEPKTGRTHQIRVHFASIGYPLVGDGLYGRRRGKALLPRQFLHAWRLEFDHPATGQRLELEAGLPPDLAEVLQRLRR